MIKFLIVFSRKPKFLYLTLLYNSVLVKLQTTKIGLINMSELSIELIESLKTMGLAEYEAKVYSTLVLFERAEVKRIYEYLNIPKPSVYQSLKGLMDKGLVMMVSSKPAIYKAVTPKIALRSLIRIHEDAKKIALKELKNIEKSNIQIEDPYIIWTLFGENKCRTQHGRINV